MIKVDETNYHILFRYECENSRYVVRLVNINTSDITYPIAMLHEHAVKGDRELYFLWREMMIRHVSKMMELNKEQSINYLLESTKEDKPKKYH